MGNRCTRQPAHQQHFFAHCPRTPIQILEPLCIMERFPIHSKLGQIRMLLRQNMENTRMAKKDHVSETPATALLKAHKLAFTEHPYEYLEHGGAQHSAQVLGFDPYSVVKTLVMQDQDAKPLLVLMHGNRKVSTKNLARQIGAKSVEPCTPEVANRHSGYLVVIGAPNTC